MIQAGGTQDAVNSGRLAVSDQMQSYAAIRGVVARYVEGICNSIMESAWMLHRRRSVTTYVSTRVIPNLS